MFTAYKPERGYDEYFSATDQPRRALRPLMDSLGRLGIDELNRNHAAAGVLLRRLGATFRLNGSGNEGVERILPFDPLPRLISNSSWQRLEQGLIQRLEAIIRLFNQYGNRANKNKARLKFVVLERGWDWVKQTIEENYADILANGGVPVPTNVPEGFGGFVTKAPELGTGAELPIIDNKITDPDFDRWLETNVTEQKQPGYAAVTVLVPQGNLTGDQMRGVAKLAEETGDGMIRVTIEQNLVLGFVQVANLRRVYASLKLIGLNLYGANEIADVVTCPGAYSCNLALTKTMNLGAALYEAVKNHPDKAVRKLNIRSSGCPNSCGQHWIGDIGFYGNARKINGKEVPYYMMLLGGGYDETGIMRFGLSVQSIPARLAPAAAQRVLDHFVANRQDGENFRQYVMRHKVAFFKEMTADLAKPSELAPEMYNEWGDDEAYSLQLGRGECAS